MDRFDYGTTGMNIYSISLLWHNSFLLLWASTITFLKLDNYIYHLICTSTVAGVNNEGCHNNRNAHYLLYLPVIDCDSRYLSSNFWFGGSTFRCTRKLRLNAWWCINNIDAGPPRYRWCINNIDTGPPRYLRMCILNQQTDWIYCCWVAVLNIL